MTSIFDALRQATLAGLDVRIIGDKDAVNVYYSLASLHGRGGHQATCKTQAELENAIQQATLWAKTTGSLDGQTITRQYDRAGVSFSVTWETFDPWNKGPQWHGLMALPGGHVLSIISPEREMITAEPTAHSDFHAGLYFGTPDYENPTIPIVPKIHAAIGDHYDDGPYLIDLTWDQVLHLGQLLTETLNAEGHA